MSDEGKSPNGDIGNDPAFVDPVTGEKTREDSGGSHEPPGWLPPAPNPDAPAGTQPDYGGWLPPAAGPQIPVTPSARIDVGRRDYANWWSRVGANVLDSFIVAIPILILALLVYLLAIGDSLSWSEDRQEFEGSIDGAQIVAVVIAGLAALIYGLGYAPFLLARNNGQTIGKKVANIRVVRADGQPISFWFAAAREIGVKSFAVGIAAQFTFGIATLLNYLWPLWDKENRAVHDLIMKTLVVKAPIVPQTADSAGTAPQL